MTEVRTFLGKASYYRKFVEDFSKIATPLSDLVKKDDDVKGKTIALNREAIAAFETLKSIVQSERTRRVRRPDLKDFVDHLNAEFGELL